MNEVEFEKYITKAILPLYPDVEDQPCKRVILKVDSGPGRTNVDMLARLKALGVYLISSVPNTTHVTQEADQSFGLFKTIYRSNLSDLTEYFFGRNETFEWRTLSCVVLEAFLARPGLELQSAFERAFSHERNGATPSWKPRH